MPATRVRSCWPAISRTFWQSLTAGVSGTAGETFKVLPTGRPSRGSTKRGVAVHAASGHGNHEPGIARLPESGRIDQQCPLAAGVRRRRREAPRNAAGGVGWVRGKSGGRIRRSQQVFQKQGGFIRVLPRYGYDGANRAPRGKYREEPQTAWKSKRPREKADTCQNMDGSIPGRIGRKVTLPGEPDTADFPRNSRIRHLMPG
jgi:hypothetical protein